MPLDPPSPPCAPYRISPKTSLRKQVARDKSDVTPPPIGSPTTFHSDPFVSPVMWSSSMKGDTSLSAPGRSSPKSPFAPGLSSVPRAGPTSLAHESSSGFQSASSKGSVPNYSMTVAARRASRFDPMDPDGDEDEDGYGDLGSRHPLRRVTEEGSDEGISLPSIKALFGSGEVPGTPSSLSGHASTLPPLVPPSPSSSSSPSIPYRTTRYASSGSSFSTISENGVGWWAPEYERGGPSSSTSLPSLAPSQSRSHSFPYSTAFSEDRDAKRRRSDQPVTSGDPEEAARMRWQAQTRNASLPTSGSISGPSGSSLRHHMLPPPTVSNLARGSISHAFHGLGEDRPPTIPRSLSIVGGQLARSFADLTAADRASANKSPSMGPPILPPPPLDRRPSLFPPAPLSHSTSSHASTSPLASEDKRTSLPPISSLSSPSPFSGTLKHDSTQSAPISRRVSLSRPTSPDRPAGPRRSSLTEIIKAKTGDDVAMASERSPGTRQAKSAEEQPRSDAGTPRRSSADSGASNSGQSAATDLTSKSAKNIRKRGARSEESDAPPPNQGGSGSSRQGAMDLLAEGATRASEADADADGDGDGDGGDEDPDQTQDKAGTGGGPKYTCAYCLKTFSRPSSLRIHTYSHTGERPFECPEPSCRRKFSVQSNLKRHSKVHQVPGTAGSSASGAASTAPTPSQPATSRPTPAPAPTPNPSQEYNNNLIPHSPYSSSLPPNVPHPHIRHSHSPLGTPQPNQPQTATPNLSPMRATFSSTSPGGMSISDQGHHSRVVHPPPIPSPTYHQPHPQQPHYGNYGYAQSHSHTLAYPPLPASSHPHQHYIQHHHPQHPHHIPDDAHHYLPHISPDHQYYHQPPMHQPYLHHPQSAHAHMPPYDHPSHHPQYLHPAHYAHYSQYPVVPSERYLQPSAGIPGHGSGLGPGSVQENGHGQAVHSYSGYGIEDEVVTKGESDEDDAEGDEIEEDE